MRVDRFLNATNICKRRTVAQDLLAHNLISLNGAIVKQSHRVKIGDIIEIKFLEYTKKYQILAIPESKNIPKSDKEKFIKEL